MKIALIHNVEIEIDSRTQKEYDTLSRSGYQVIFCGWNKDKTARLETKEIVIREKKVMIQNICQKVKKKKGVKDNIGALLSYEFKLTKWLIENRKKYELIHACSLDIVLVGLPIARILRKRIIYDIYDDYADSHVVGKTIHSFIKKIDAFFLKRVDAVIICSEKRKEQLATPNVKKLCIIHNTPDIIKVRDEVFPIEKNDNLKIVYVGNLNGERLVLEMAELVSRHKEWEFHCAGGGLYETKLEKLANKQDNIFFYGKLSYEETLALENQCDIIPAIYDPTILNHKYAAPNKFYEALYLGKPTIMIHGTGMDDLVEKYQTGFTVNFSISEIENVFTFVYQNLEKWRLRKNDIYKVYDEYFSWRIMENRLLQIYKDIGRQLL